MQKDNIHILSTRPLSSEIIKEAATKNIVIDQLSFIETTLIEDKNTTEAIQQYLQQNIVAVFTSMNAVEAVAKHINKPPQWKIYAIGNTTKTLVAEHFGEHAIAGTAVSAEELGKVIVKDKIGAIVFFCGDQRRDELPEKLQQNGVSTNELVVYNTVATPVLVSKQYNGILFFSPSAVQSFFSVNKADNDARLFAIGSTTAGAIQQYNKSNVIISGSPGKENLVRDVLKYYSQERLER